MSDTPGIEVGFYGKLPSHGDFLRRRVSDTFVQVWDEWIQECLVSSRSALSDGWLDVYLTSPAWRFACDAGLFGEAPVLGLMVPSVDRVGRYFYLTIVAELPAGTDVVGASLAAGGFYDSAEQLVLDTLAAEVVDFDAFDRQVIELGQQLAPVIAPRSVTLDASAAAILGDGVQTGWRLPTVGPLHLKVLEQVLAHRLAALYAPLVLWWTDGSAFVEPSCLVGRGLPGPESFAAFLDGSWDQRQWQSVAGQVEPDADSDDTLVEEAISPLYRSSAASDVGRVRAVNQDAFLERPDVGIWAVADGLGGLSDGEVASRMVCDALSDFVPDQSFERVIEEAAERIQDVNRHLVRAAERPVNAVVSGSTVVVLLIRGARCAVIWAGDSKLFRVRRGQLQPLTRDHSLAADAEGPLEGNAANAVTRAVGGEPVLTLDVHHDRVRLGDRFLLCSDGLTRVVPEHRILEWMQHEDVGAAASGLIATTLEGGAPDNVTVVVVEAYAPPSE